MYIRFRQKDSKRKNAHITSHKKSIKKDIKFYSNFIESKKSGRDGEQKSKISRKVSNGIFDFPLEV